MIRIIFLVICPFICLWSQNSFNEKGQRDGVWLGYHNDGQIKYNGQFDNGLECGVFNYYDYDGNIVIHLDYVDPGVKSHAIIYYSSGAIKSKGDYLNKQKNGDWIQYNQSGKIIAKETYVNGVLNGETLYYYDNGYLSEKCYYINNIKTGLSEIFYQSGFINMRCFYLNEQLTGIAEYYYDNSNQLESIGKYVTGIKDSIWVFYSELGDTLNIVNYSSLDE